MRVRDLTVMSVETGPVLLLGLKLLEGRGSRPRQPLGVVDEARLVENPDVASLLFGGEIQGVEIHAVDVERVVEFRG